MIWKAKFCSCEYTTVKFTKTAIKFLGVQAAKKCTAPNRCEEREKRWAFAKWWFDVKCMHLMTLLSLCPWIFARLQPHKLWCTMIILTKHDGSHGSMVHIIACPRTAKLTKDWCDPTRFHHFGPKTLRKRGKHGSVFQQILSQMISRNHGCFTDRNLIQEIGQIFNGLYPMVLGWTTFQP